jgi:TPR repeat protein
MDYAASYVNLGVLFQEGLGTPKNYEAARQWYKKACPSIRRRFSRSRAVLALPQAPASRFFLT